MWHPPNPISFLGQELSGREAWVHVFSLSWDELETERELCMTGFETFGAAVAEQHGEQDPGEVARRLFPEAGEYRGDIYPSGAATVDVRAFIAPEEVPF